MRFLRFKNKLDKSWTHVGHVSHGFLGISETSKILNLSTKTVQRWCESGKLPAIPQVYGKKTTYLISHAAIEVILNQQAAVAEEKQKKKAVVKKHSGHVDGWVKAMEKGTMTGKPFSPYTVQYYRMYADEYFSHHEVVSHDGIRQELMKTDAHQFGRKEKYFKAILSFGKYLIQQGCLDESFVTEVMPLYPKRSLPPKRLSIDEAGLKKLIESVTSPLDKVIVVLLAHTGLRASEFCALRHGDIDLETGTLLVKLGKGNKSRKVGLSMASIDVLKAYLEMMPELKPGNYLFYNATGKPLKRDGLYQRVERIGSNAGVSASPHALRRAFVTINANAGRPLQMLQRACGHSDIKTTMAYCRTSEQEVIDAMKGW